VSLAFISRTSKPKASQIMRAADVLPMPGGPDRRHDLELGLG